MNKKLPTVNSKQKSKPFPIVAIGASAGGLEAISELLHHLAPDTGMAFVYIQHLDPTHKSMLSTILSRVTKMKVLEAQDLLPIEKDHLYIIPPNKDMAIVDGVLALGSRKSKPSVHMPVDKFFVSLAEKHKERGIGVVLSGNATDGTFGLKAIKIAGGITIAQDETAKFQSMPQSAIAQGVVDMVLSPKEMAIELNQLSKNSNIIHKVLKEPGEEDIIDADEDLKNIIQILKKSTGVDFTHYKQPTIKRQLLRRMFLCRLETLKDYLQYLKQHTREVNILYNDLLINATNFFRDPDAFEYLKKTLIFRIIKNKTASEPVRIWIPACSTGEEVYSLAIIFMEVIGDKASNTTLQIFATDLSEQAIAKARMGVYSGNELAEVSVKRLQRFFMKIDGHYRIVKSIRDLCVFAHHNIFRDPPFSRLDLISCCNLMIYMDEVMQKKIIGIFHYALNSNGYLVLGKSETISTSTRLFSQLEKKYKIYSKKSEEVARAKIEINYSSTKAERNEAVGTSKKIQIDSEPRIDLESIIDGILLNKYILASVVVNDALEILQFRGSTGLFLEPLPGKASLNLLKMAKPGLAFELRSTILKAGKLGHPVKKTALEIKRKGTICQVSIEVSPLKTHGEEKLFLVVFEERTAPPISGGKSAFTKDIIVKQLQDELESLKMDMHALLEEKEAHVKELQSANEEIVSSNEELQSINEELETFKEEVESNNEELMTVNTELQIRNEDLTESYEYAEAMFDTIREAVLVLDQDFRVRSANQAFYKIFQVKKEETEGRLIYELGDMQWNILRLRELLEEVIPRNIVFHGFEVAHNFPDLGEKVMLLNARRIKQQIHKKHLILLAIEDITEYRLAQKILAEREAWFRNMADHAPVMIWGAGVNKQKNFFNRTWLEYTGQSAEKAMDEEWTQRLYPEDLEGYEKIFNTSFDERKPFDIEYRLKRYDDEYRWIFEIGKPTISTEGIFTGFIGSCTEIHDKRIIHDELEQKVQQRTHDLHEMNQELQRSNSELQQFAYVASHDLQEPLRKIMTFSDRLQRFSEVLPDHAKTYIEKIATSSQRMRRLIDDLLNFSRTSKFNKKFVPTDLNKLLKNVSEDFDLIMAQKKGLIQHNTLPIVEAIPVQMEQLFHNLISNALKFSRDNEPPIIEITSRILSHDEINKQSNLDQNIFYAEIIFKDNGIGFNLEFAEQIFVIFQRLNEKHTFPGTGIGLALCRKIVENHGGEIFATSNENEGAEFHIILPIEQE